MTITRTTKKTVSAFIAMGDTMGYGAFTSRVSTTAANYNNFVIRLFTMFTEFKNEHPYFFVDGGDGFLCIAEESQCDLNKWMRDVSSLATRIDVWIDNLPWASRPEGFLIRVLKAPLIKVQIGANINYFGEGINLADRLKKVARYNSHMAHTSIARSLQGQPGMEFEKYSNGHPPDGVTRDDLKNILKYSYVS